MDFVAIWDQKVGILFGFACGSFKGVLCSAVEDPCEEIRALQVWIELGFRFLRFENRFRGFGDNNLVGDVWWFWCGIRT